MTKAKQLLALGALGVLASAALVMPGFAQPGGKGDKKEQASGVSVGSAAPAFTLKDTDGKEVSLDALRKDGKIVIAFWFSPECPFVKKHFEKGGNTFNDMYAKYKDKKVSIVAINSAATGEQGSGKETNTNAKKNWKIEFPIALDESGETGKAYGAKTTPHIYIVDKTGNLVYMGGHDNKGDRNYIAESLDAMLAGKPVPTAKTENYGCAVHY